MTNPPVIDFEPDPWGVAEAMLKTNAFRDLIPANQPSMAGYVVLEAAPTAIPVELTDEILTIGGLSVLVLAVYLLWRFRQRIFTRKLAGAIAAGLFIIMLLNPPWRITVQNDKGHTKRNATEWAFITDTPMLPNEAYQSAQVATDIMCLEFLGLSAIGIAVHFLLPKPRA